VNNRKSLVLREGKLVEAKWQTVVVGDIIKMENDQFVAVIIILYRVDSRSDMKSVTLFTMWD
jgi:magnesium-transporting ATPase (P-type)